MARKGRKWAATGLVLQVCKRTPEDVQENIEADAIRVGFTVTKKVGNAVIRNRVRRRLKAAANQVIAEAVTGGLDVVVIGRMGTIKRPFGALTKDLKTALRKLKAVKPDAEERKVEQD